MPAARRRAVALGASTLVAGIVLAVAALPQVAAASTSPVLPGQLTKEPVYKMTKSCVGGTSSGTPVANGVSAAQRTLQFTSAWPFSKGANVKVGVIDTGVNPSPAFQNRLHGVADMVVPNQAGSQDPGLTDCDGHGTLVAGLIAAAPDPKSGFSGVAPEAEIYSIRQSSKNYTYKDRNDQEKTAGNLPDLAAAINYLATVVKVGVINISVAGCGAAGTVDDTPSLDAAVADAVKTAVVVVAAGNVEQGTECSPQNVPGKTQVTAATPADQPGVLAVGALDPNGDPAEFSLVGPEVSLAAPGTDIISVNPDPKQSGQVNTIVSENGRGSIQGTSFSAPYVAGVAALVRGAHPTWSAADVVQVLKETAAHPAAPGGRNQYVGYGLVDPLAAVTAAKPGTQTVGTQRNPILLPAERTVRRSARPGHVALYGTLIVSMLIIGGLIAVQARRTRRRSAARLVAARRRELTRAR